MKRATVALLFFTILVGGGATWQISSVAARDRQQLGAERKRAVLLRRQIEDANQQASLVASRTADTRDETTHAATLSAQPPPAPSQEQQVADWLARVKRLKASFETHPDQAIPEFALLTELEWVTVARTLGDDTEESLRRARAETRSQAAKKFLQLLRPALDEFRQANQRLPADLAELVPLLQPPLDTAMLARYELRPSGPAGPMSFEVLAERAPLDVELDQRHALTRNGSSGGAWATAFLKVAVDMAIADAMAAARSANPFSIRDTDLLPFIHEPIAREIFSAQLNYRREHDGKESTDPAGLRPYVSSAAGRAQLETMIRAHRLKR